MHPNRPRQIFSRYLNEDQVGGGPSGINGITTRDEGTVIGDVAGVQGVNFVGTGVTVTGAGANVTVTIPGQTAGIAGITTLDEGIVQGTPAGVNFLNFVGAGVTAVGVGSTTTVTIPTPATAVVVKDEGTIVTSTGSNINFVGPGVTATAAGTNVTVTVPGGIPGISVSYYNTPIPTPFTQTNIDFHAFTGVTVTDGTLGRTQIDFFDPASYVYFGDNTSANNGGPGSVTIGPDAITAFATNTAVGNGTQVLSTDSSACGNQNVIPAGGSNCSLMGQNNGLGGLNNDVAITGANNHFKDALTKCSVTGVNNYSDGILDLVHVVGNDITIPSGLTSIQAFGSAVDVQSNNCFISGISNSIKAHSESSIAIFGNVDAGCQYSVCFGEGSSVSKGQGNVSIGFRASTSSASGTALGQEATVTDDGGCSFGFKSNCAGAQGVAIGAKANCDTSSGVAIGDQSQAISSKTNIAIGFKAFADSNICTSVGAESKASHTDGGCTAMGAGAQALGSETTCFGVGAVATGKDGISVGVSIDNGEDNTIILGHLGSCTTVPGVYGPGANTIIGNQAQSDRNSNTTAVGQACIIATNNESSSAFGKSCQILINAAASCAFGAGAYVDANASGSCIFGHSARSNINGGLSLGAGATANPFSGLNNDSPFALNVNSNAVKIGPIIGTVVGGLRVCLNGVRYILPLWTNN